MDSDRGLRARVAAAEWFLPLVAVCLAVALLGGWLAYTAYAAPGTTVDQQPGPAAEVRGGYDYAAIVTEPNPLYEDGETLVDRPFYFYGVSPELQGDFTYGFQAAEGGQLEVEATTVLVLRSATEEETGRTVYWTDNETLASRAATVQPGGTVSVPFAINTSAARLRAERIEEDLGGSPGELEASVVTRVDASGRINGRSVSESRSYQLPLSLDTSGFSVPYDGPTVEDRTRTVAVPVERDYGPLWRVGGPLALLSGLGGAAALVLADRRGELDVSEADRRRLAAASARQEYDDWITTARLPDSGTEGPTVEVESLEGLVDLAIDTGERVLESPDGDAYRVLHDDYVYVFRFPEQSGDGDGDVAGAAESTPHSADAPGPLTGDGAGQTVPPASEMPPDGSRGPAPREVDFDDAMPAASPAPERVEFEGVTSVVERVPRSVSLENAVPAVERVPEPSAVGFEDAVSAVDPVTSDDPTDGKLAGGSVPDAGPNLSELASGEDLTAVPELGAADADRLHSAGFPTVTSLARADPSRVAKATGMTTGYAEQVIDSAAELAREGPSVRAVEGVGEVYAEQLREAGIETAADLAAAEPTYVASRTDISPALAETLVQRAGDLEGELARED
jgi:predicted flap endonuclease-1-like 5' DNA nuclease